MKIILKIVLAITFALTSNYANAQNLVNKVKLNWKEIGNDNTVINSNVSYLDFDGAVLNLPSPLPVYSFIAKLPASKNAVEKVQLKNQVYTKLSNEEELLISKLNITDNPKINFEIVTEKKIRFAKISIVPIKKSGNGFEKLISFDVETYFTNDNSASRNMANSYAANSILASGTWYKVGVTKDGIYKVNASFLKKLDADITTINPQNIRVYGNAGKQIPFLNSASRIDDLAENPIYVEGEADGVLDSTDYFWFYAHGPHAWHKTNDCAGYRHVLNDYSDTSYYFINTDLGTGLRLSTIQQSTAPATSTITSFDDLQFHENEAVNLRISGREFYGEKFDNQLNINYDFNVPNIDINDSAVLKASFCATSSPPATFTVSCVGSQKSVSPKVAPALGSGNSAYILDMASDDSLCMKFKPNASSVNVGVDFIKNPQYSSGFGFLNFIDVISRRQLQLSSNMVIFRDSRSVGANNIGKFIIGNVQQSTIVLNVTNTTSPVIQASNFSNNNLEFVADCSTINEYLAFTPGTGALQEPTPFGKVENQNLHATAPVDMIIISHSLFSNEALRLKKMHEQKDNFRVVLVTPQQIYNEFSGGMQDLAGLRMFGKMLYDRASTEKDLPKHILLFGDASYVNRIRSTNGNTNFVPVYESKASLDLISSYCTDDFFGLLDDTESEGASSSIDLAIGRLPAKTADEAKAMVDKIMDYVTKKPLPTEAQNCIGCCNSNGVAANITGDWRNVMCMVADDEDSNLHVGDGESNTDSIRANAKEINVEKLYLDMYKQVTDAGGQRYPDVNSAFNARMDKGALIVNYSGHGGEVGLTAERVLGIEDIKNWKNKGRYPFFVTATCEFTRYDDPARTSAGELTVLQPDGGGIGLATTTRLVYQSSNKVLNNNFYHVLFNRDTVTNKHLKIGEILRLVKNSSAVISSGPTNARKFALMGDPAITLDFPEYYINTTAIEVMPKVYAPDTVRALSKVKITGFVCDKNNQKLTNFTGLVYPTVYDKVSTIKTLGNDAGSPKINIKTRKNIIYKGKVSVTKGDFTFEFIVPKDIAYQYGGGRISYYAETNTTDAAGYTENFTIGGINLNAAADSKGPEVKLYMNDEKFVSGSLTDENPKLIAVIEDENGINTVGSGIGHDISAVIDAKTDKSIVLNDYYQSELNSYQKGNVQYGFSTLAEGSHNIQFKVWDVYNNSSDASIDFVVAKNAIVALNHVLNYPNPFTTNTTFMFEHNKPCQALDVQIQIFTVSGKLIKSIVENIATTGFRSEDLKWDGLDDYGDKIGKGVYIYKLKVTAQDGTVAEKLEKLVMLQ